MSNAQVIRIGARQLSRLVREAFGPPNRSSDRLYGPLYFSSDSNPKRYYALDKRGIAHTFEGKSDFDYAVKYYNYTPLKYREMTPEQRKQARQNVRPAGV